MLFPARRLWPALAALLVLFTACGTSPSLPTTAGTAVLTVSCTPNPILAVTSSQLGATFSAQYKVVINETAGQGGVIQSITSILYDEVTGSEVGIVSYDTSDLVVFVGQKRIEANGSITVPQQIDYTIPLDAAAKAARVQVSVVFKDDLGHNVTASILVKVE